MLTFLRSEETKLTPKLPLLYSSSQPKLKLVAFNWSWTLSIIILHRLPSPPGGEDAMYDRFWLRHWRSDWGCQELCHHCWEVLLQTEVWPENWIGGCFYFVSNMIADELTLQRIERCSPAANWWTWQTGPTSMRSDGRGGKREKQITGEKEPRVAEANPPGITAFCIHQCTMQKL